MAKPLWSQIYDELEGDILSGKLPPEASLPPELEIAARWGVSRLTAHRALYELQRAGLVARKRKVGTVVASREEAAKTVRIGALFFHAGDYFQGNLLGAVRAGLAEECHLSYVDTNRDPALEAAALLKMREEADGIVLFPTCHPSNDALLERLASEIPLVCIDRHPQGMVCDSVQTDNYAATRHLLGPLVQAGHRRVACFCDFEEGVSSTSDRVRAYRDLLEMVGADTRQHFHAFAYYEPNTESEYRDMVAIVRDALVEAFDREDAPTALFCTREHYVSAAVEACAEIGVPVPEMAAFVDRPSYLMALPDSVRRVTQDLDAIGRLAAERITRRIHGERLAPEQFLVPAREMID